MKKLTLLLVFVLAIAMCAPAMAYELPLVSEPTTLSIWVAGAETVTDMDTNTLSLWLEEKTGVDVTWIHVPTEAETKFNLTISSGTYPDIYFKGFSADQALLYANNGIFLRLNDLIENNSVYYKDILEKEDLVRNSVTAEDGSIYTFFYSDVGVHMYCTDKMWVYEPWVQQYMDATGSEKPVTTDEFEQMLIYFRDNDMNGNGDASDEMPIVGVSSAWSGDPLAFLMNPYQLWNGNFLVAKDDTVSFIANTDEYREGLKYANRLYSEGLIDEATYVQDIDQMKPRITVTDPKDVTIGAFPAAHVPEYIDCNVFPDALVDYAPYEPLEGPTGLRQANYAGNMQVSLNTAITTTCEHPEVAFEFCDFLLGGEGGETHFWGFEGKLEDGGTFVWSDDPAVNGSVPSRVLTFNSGAMQNTFWGAPGPGPVYDSIELRYSETDVYGWYAWTHYRGHTTYEPYYTFIGLPQVSWCADEDLIIERNEQSILFNEYVKMCNTEFVLGARFFPLRSGSRR